jgi:hypothetical protein
MPAPIPVESRQTTTAVTPRASFGAHCPERLISPEDPCIEELRRFLVPTSALGHLVHLNERNARIAARA